MLSRDDVVFLYRSLLDREPESDQLVEWFTQVYPDLRQASIGIMKSEEFKLLNQMPKYSDVFYEAPTLSVQQGEMSLALAAIVKNEQSNIARMLASCIPVISFAVVVDTGSTDRTKAIAEDALVRAGVDHTIVDVPFENFSQARNIALDLVPKQVEWVIMLDADEHLVPEDFPKLTSLLNVDKVDAWQLPRYNFVDAEKKHAVSPYPDYQKRLFRNRQKEKIRYIGAVHETVVNAKSWGYAPANDAFGQDIQEGRIFIIWGRSV